jgi:hypothetical protein
MQSYGSECGCENKVVHATGSMMTNEVILVAKTHDSVEKMIQSCP